MPLDNSDLSPTYALRILPRAERDINIAIARFIELHGKTLAQQWQDGLFVAVSTLAHSPRRFALSPENEHFPEEVRQSIYRRTPASVAYRLLFVVQDETEDGPTVSLIHVRHGSARPITHKEAREIERQNRF